MTKFHFYSLSQKKNITKQFYGEIILGEATKCSAGQKIPNSHPQGIKK
jgi:hypothetical protein